MRCGAFVEQMQQDELERYKRGLDSVHQDVDDINNESANTDQIVSWAAKDAAVEDPPPRYPLNKTPRVVWKSFFLFV